MILIINQNDFLADLQEFLNTEEAKELNIDIYKQSSKATIDSMIEAIIKD